MQPERILVHVRKLSPKRATRIKLYILAIDGERDEEMGDWPVAEYEGDLAKDLAKELFDSGQLETDERGGSRKYVVSAIDVDNNEVYKWNMRFTASSNDPTAPSLDLDEPTMQGQLAQIMRHQERQFTACMASQERIVRSLHEQLELRDKRIASLEKRELEVIEMAREIRLHTAEDSGGERNADRLDKAITLITEKFLPAIGVQVGILPEGFNADGDPALLKQTKIEPDQADEVVPAPNADQPS